MHQIHPDSSLVPLLERMVASDLHYHLYTNNVTPDRDTELGDLTEMGGGTGYSIITVDAADFTLTGVSAHKGFLIAAPITFVIGVTGSPTDVYGYYVTDTGNAELLAVARFDDAPIDITAGANIPVVPVMGDSSQFAS